MQVQTNEDRHGAPPASINREARSSGTNRTAPLLHAIFLGHGVGSGGEHPPMIVGFAQLDSRDVLARPTRIGALALAAWSSA
jgi:hypothetical protein